MHSEPVKMAESRDWATASNLQKKTRSKEGSLMKMHTQALALATIASILSIPALAQTQDNPATQDTQTAEQLGAAHEATQMVPANAILARTVDAKNDRPDSTVEARVKNKVTLSDGTVLPSGALLIGKVVQDGTEAAAGTSELALLFNQARLKDGTVVPIKATIVGLYTSSTADSDNDMPNSWTPKTSDIDQLSVSSGVDLHSNIASNNSGILVSNSKHDIKLGAGSELQFAIGPARSGL
jgi:hypothetical protein